ncbi:glycine zipper 2TM domain-containing protein [Haloferula rosea]|uniref:Glycine zipper 2TM domain-containing protein n=1 Tax=Haloferula rosea TaxID=490093 RepID=A0A934VFQ1_9BACT|nr:glycine zipper 2TM domain-containing protein [Haloferula rosea]MBK1828589.1 glycine zipper 2TM domain-containing protein [Haloferula rosea]
MKMLLPLLMLPAFLGSCAQQPLTGDNYSRSEVGTPQSVRTGKITSIRNVNLEGSRTGGAILGAVAGGFLGNQVGGGSGQDAATIGGAALGGAAGSHAGRAINNRQGLEITVRLDEGGSLSIVQEVSKNESFAVGERVRVLDNGRRARVTH